MDLRLKEVRFLEVGPLSFSLKASERVTLFGASGVGKSQMLRAIVDLSPFTGSIEFGGQQTAEIPPTELRLNLGYLPAESAWWFDLVSPHFKKPQELPLTDLGFTSGILDQEVYQLSSGEKQRLGLLRMLEMQPKFLLLDEPTASLDPSSVGLMEDLIVDYCDKTGAGYLWVSHDPSQAKRMGTRCLELKPNEVAEL
ncbi:MAG: ATP-binding cassette domain-containing protein [SAR324 cluster bacterium]|nr:ATP-binding cassette domain-containing protein [SAR324 cluster bacterium]